jgi:PAS domain S-box-containing protein
MKSQSLLNRNEQLVFASAILALLVAGAMSYRAMMVSMENDRWVRHTHEVIESLQDLLFAMESIDSSCHEFVLTGREALFESYGVSIVIAKQDEATLRKLTMDNANQQSRLPTLERLMTQKVQFAETVSNLRRDHGIAAASELVDQGEGERLMDEMRELIKDMEAEERGLLEVRTAASHASAKRARLVMGLAALLALGSIITAGGIVQSHISKRKRVEEKLRRLAAIVESSGDAILSKNLDGIIQSWNHGAERLYGYPASEVVGQSVAILAPPGGKDEISGILASLARGDPIEHYETERTRKDGQKVDVSLAVSLIKDSTGKVVGASTIARDITGRKRAEAEIKELNSTLGLRMAEVEAANKELEAFTYSVSHDLRAPLRHISGFSKILLEEYAPQLDQTAQHYIQRVSNATTQMGLLVDDLLNLSRLGRRELNRQPAGLNSLVEEVLVNRRQEIEGRDIKWRIGQLPFVDCDPTLMKQVFDNLLANAIKFTRPRRPAVIEVDQETLAGETVIYVRDNGVGFSMKYAGKLFGVFQRLHRAEDFEGTGVGLATAQRIIRKHGGRIWAEAELDKGATFYFTTGPANQSEEQTPAPDLIKGDV